MPITRPVAPAHGDSSPRERLLALVDAFPRRRVLVVGDIVADEFLSGQISRVSREAPVLILRYDVTRTVPGGAGNAANNVAALGGRVDVFGLIGRDEAGRALLASLPRHVNARGLVKPAGYRTPSKTRVLAGGIHSAKQQIVRIDREPQARPDANAIGDVYGAALRAVPGADAIVLSDYGYGLVTPVLAAELAAAAGERPILVDSRYDLGSYRGLTACTPNEPEVEQLLGVKIDDDAESLERAGRSLLRRSKMKAVLVTRGSRGMALFEPGAPTTHIPIYGSDEIADVTGAGDTVMATMALALAAGASFADAARLANYAGGIVVMKRGTATASAQELRAAIEADTGGAGL
jgi:rfaE bifunctional protein kinase chain/domain